jgi:hypothetical protein
MWQRFSAKKNYTCLVFILEKSFTKYMNKANRQKIGKIKWTRENNEFESVDGVTQSVVYTVHASGTQMYRNVIQTAHTQSY